VILAVATVVVYALGVGASHVVTRLFVGTDAERLDSDLQSSLSIGSSMDAGRTWFARHGIEPVESETFEGRYLKAILPDDTLLETADIHIWLCYDFEGRLRFARALRYLTSR
jgi:hypothetical protein